MATTINAYAASLSLDASRYIDASKASRKETQSLQRMINSSRSPMDRYERSVKQLDNALKKGAISQQTYNRLLDSAKAKLGQAKTAATGYSGAMGGTTQRIIAATAAYVSFNAIFRQLTEGIKDNAALEQTQVQFEVLTGSVEDATRVMANLRQFAASTPFQLPEIQRAGGQLLAFKFAANEVVDAVKILGDISAGTGAPLGELASVIGKMRVQGRIFAEDINQLTGRGINVIDGLAEKFGDVRKAVKDGKVQFSDLYEVLQQLTEEGGKFYEMTAKQGETAAGKWSTLVDKAMEYRRLLADILVTTEGIGGATGFLDSLAFETANFFSNGGTGQAFISENAAANAEEERFRREQLAKRNRERNEGLLPGSLTSNPTDLGKFGAQVGEKIGSFMTGSGSALFGGFTGAAEQLKDAAAFQWDVYQNQIQVQNQEAAARRNKPELADNLAPSALRGSQEAYKIITGARNAMEAKREKQDQERNKLLNDLAQKSGQQLAQLQQLIPQELM